MSTYSAVEIIETVIFLADVILQYEQAIVTLLERNESNR